MSLEDPGSNPAWGCMMEKILTKNKLWSSSYVHWTVIKRYGIDGPNKKVDPCYLYNQGLQMLVPRMNAGGC